MPSYPDFSANGYQIIEELSHNVQGGRVTYKAIEIITQTPVIIKQFRFANSDDWNSYKAIEREIKVLQGLNHPGIPKYLNRFDPGDGLCLVQEYINAQPLSTSRSFNPEEIKSIAIQLLEILVYLQDERIPPIFHQDIKPENVLVDDKTQVYLIDFGLARISSNTMALSSMMGGTMGFIPPEQIRNLKPTEASDLYSLGATLICLITRTKSIDIGNLVDFDTNKFTFKERVPKFSFRFIQWLEKMVEPNPANRYQNAKLALEALQPLYVMRVPEVSLETTELEFIAEKVGERITKNFIINNNIPETTLQGNLSVYPHPNDPPHTPDSHAWIRCFPQQFEGNNVHCQITVDTSKLRANKHYQRELVLHSNATEVTYSLKIKVKTAKLNLHVLFPPYLTIASFLISLILLSSFICQTWVINGADITKIVSTYVSQLSNGGFIGAILWSIIGLAFGFILLVNLYGLVKAFNVVSRMILAQFKDKGFNPKIAIIYIILTLITGISTGISLVFGLTTYLTISLTVSSLPLIAMLLYSPLRLRQLKIQYRRQESEHLIE